MRKLLQNKWVVSVLVVVAVILIARPFVRRPLVRARQVANTVAPVVDSGEAPVDLVAEISVPAPSPLDWHVVDSISAKPARDPFRPVDPAPTETAKAEASSVELPTVQAISRQGGQAYAVCNHRVLSVGESVDGYVLLEILRDEVRVRRQETGREYRIALFPNVGGAGTLRPKGESADNSPANRVIDRRAPGNPGGLNAVSAPSF